MWWSCDTCGSRLRVPDFLTRSQNWRKCLKIRFQWCGERKEKDCFRSESACCFFALDKLWRAVAARWRSGDVLLVHGVWLHRQCDTCDLTLRVGLKCRRLLSMGAQRLISYVDSKAILTKNYWISHSTKISWDVLLTRKCSRNRLFCTIQSGNQKVTWKYLLGA